MPHLELQLFGPFQAVLDGRPLLEFQSNKVRALLAYLATEGTHPHHRVKVSTLLWPRMDDSAALRNLRYAIADLRRRLGDTHSRVPFLLVTRYTIQLNPLAEMSVDVVAFRDRVRAAARSNSEEEAVRCWQAALTLVRGEFLQGLQVRHSVPWEEWLLLRREEFEQGLLQALRALAWAYERQERYEHAQTYVRQWLRHVPWDEEAHRQLIRLLALEGRRTAALAQYERCRAVLENDLGVEPTLETTALANAIRAGESPSPVSRQPQLQRTLSTLSSMASPQRFVGREAEMARLVHFLDAALSGEPQVAFVTGEAGSGKSTLAATFGRKVLASHKGVVVVRGESNAIVGRDDPFLPFRDILLALIGRDESMHLGSVMGEEYARQLLCLAPAAIPLLIQSAPDVIHALGLASALAMQVEAFLPRSARTQSLLQELNQLRKAADESIAPRSQSRSFTQFVQVFEEIATQSPLLVILDDLQWADANSLSLLFHLGRRLHGSRIFLLGIFRNEDVLAPGYETQGPGDQGHPLPLVVRELQRQRGDIVIDLDECSAIGFVNAYLDAEPNRLGEGFRRRLSDCTGGNPLFVVELLRSLEEQGLLFKDREGCWRDREGIGWERVPPRVEAIIAKRMDRLPQRWYTLLSVASVAGESFSAELLAESLEWPLSDVLRILAALAAHPRREVQFRGQAWVGERMISHYRFRHVLFQSYLYERLTESEKSIWHGKIGAVLEAHYGSHAEDIAPVLAHHFEAAGQFLKAVHYYQLAGLRAMSRFAPVESLALYTRGQALLQQMPESPQRREQEMALRIAMNAPLVAIHGWGAPERAEGIQRAYELSRRSEDEEAVVHALSGQADILRARGEHALSLQLGEQLLRLAERLGTPSALLLAHSALGETYTFLGKLLDARRHLTQALEYYSELKTPFTPLTVVDLGVVCHVWLAWTEERLGNVNAGEAHVREAVDLGRRLKDPLSLIFALALGAYGFYWLRGQPQAAAMYEEELVTLMDQEETTMVHPWGQVFRGWVLAEQGSVSEGIEQMEAGLRAWQAMGAVCGRTCQVIPLARAHARAGQVERARALITEALQLVATTGERLFESDLEREMAWLSEVA